MNTVLPHRPPTHTHNKNKKHLPHQNLYFMLPTTIKKNMPPHQNLYFIALPPLTHRKSLCPTFQTSDGGPPYYAPPPSVYKTEKNGGAPILGGGGPHNFSWVDKLCPSPLRYKKYFIPKYGGPRQPPHPLIFSKIDSPKEWVPFFIGIFKVLIVKFLNPPTT